MSAAFATGTPPTDREALRRYESAREAFAVLGGGPTRFFPQEGEAIGRLFVIASEEEMESHRRDVHEQLIQAGEVWPHPWPEDWYRNMPYLNSGKVFPPLTQLVVETARDRRTIDATDVEKYRSKGYRVTGVEHPPTERDLLGRIVHRD
ncbi:MAG: hypothetical protein U0640_05540 [Phycisphaerales bacterium]